MFGKVAICSLLAVLAVPAAAVAAPVELVPGVTYERRVETTAHGTRIVHVVVAPKPGGLYALRPILSNEALVGRETVSSMQRRASAAATLVGVNGDLFAWADGRPSGVLVRAGAIDHPPIPQRSSIGVDAEGNLRVDRVSLSGTWQGLGPLRTVVAVNTWPPDNGVALYTPAYGDAVPSDPGAIAAVIAPFPPATPDIALTGPVADLVAGGGVAIPAGGAVLVARGTAAARLAAEAPPGQPVAVTLSLGPDWATVGEALGGGPVLVRDGKPVFRSLEAFERNQLEPRHPRTAVGQRADGRILLVAVDGRAHESIGVNAWELAQIMVGLGAVSAAALDAGGSTTLAFDGAILNSPSDPSGERPVAESLNVFYYGVYAPFLPNETLTPNGDGDADTQTLAYKIVRPSTVTAQLLGPDGAVRYETIEERAPGTYALEWDARTAEGAPEAEGRWEWRVSAIDDQGAISSASRRFWVSTALARLRVRGPALAVPRQKPRLLATFALTRPAAVRVTVERPDGTLLRTVRRARLGAGRAQVLWNGRDGRGRFVRPGRYVLRVATAGGRAPASLERHFVVRKTRGSAVRAPGRSR